jgi:hypothetical protein
LTGAGDAFAAGLATFLAEEKSLQRSAIFANAAAALTTTRMGAQAALPLRHQVEELLKQPEIAALLSEKAPTVTPAQAPSMPTHIQDILPTPEPGAAGGPHMAEHEARTVSADVVTVQRPEGKTTLVVEREAGRPPQATIVSRRKSENRQGSKKADRRKPSQSGRHEQKKS